ncbi:MAG TPA: MFS transporter [Actinomycetota bacterium]|nr:MFS transporter [Actinomycetota bacterium]
MARTTQRARRRLDPRRITGKAPLFPLVVLFGLNAVDELDRTAMNVLLPNIRDWFGISLTTLGLITAAAVPLALLLELPVAYLADRRNRVRMAVGGAGVWGTFTMLTGLAWSVPILVVARIGSSIGKLFSSAIHRSLISDYYPSTTRTRAFYVHGMANSVGQIIGPLAAGLLASRFAWRTPFVVLAIPTFIFLLLGLRLREPKRGVQERLEAGADMTTAEIEDRPPGFAETFRVLFAGRSARRIYYSLPFLAASIIGLLGFISLFYADVYNVKEVGRGIIFASVEPLQIVGVILGAIFLQRFVNDNPGRAMRMLGIAALIVAAGIVTMALSPNLAVAIAGHMLFSLVFATLLPGLLSIFSLVVPSNMRTLGFAAGNPWILLGVPVIPLVFAAGDTIGLRAGLLCLVPVYLIGSFLLASSGWTIDEDIKRVRLSQRTQAEMRRSRDEGHEKLLIVRDLDVAYDGVQVLFGVNIDVDDGEIVALLGTNGAGKSTLLKAISGLVQSTAGAILFDGRSITNVDPVQVAHSGIAQIPGGRAVFPTLTVEENIRVAGWMFRGDAEHLKESTERVLETFPVLRERWKTAAGDLSGGEQQMLSLAQAFIARPKLLLIDELTLGLSPTVVQKLLDIVRAIHDQGTTIVLVEQSVNVALKLAQRAVFLEKGEVRFTGKTRDLLDRPDVLRAVFLRGASAMSGDGAVSRPRTSAPPMPKSADVVLEVEGLTKQFGGIVAVDDVDLELRSGEILGIIGPNGAGKTTLFDLITGFQPLNSGRVTLLGRDITVLPANARTRAGLGRSFQDARLWSSLTVAETIAVAFERSITDRSPVRAMLGLPVVGEAERDVRKRAEELIELLGLGAFRDKFVSELSTGSRRIVEIATILAHRPSVLLLDEPSSGIAQKETEALGPLLRRVREFMDGSLVVVEHNVPLVSSLADRMIAMDLGRVIAEGPPAAVLRDHAVIESYLGTSGYKELVGGMGDRPRRRKTRARR